MMQPSRWLTAGLLAALAGLAAPSRSEASVTILIEEIDAAGKALPGASNSQLFNAPSVSNIATSNFGQIFVGASSNSTLASPTSSISTGFSFLNTSAISAANLAGLGLRITVTDSFDRAPGGQAAVVNTSIGAANGSVGFVGDLSVFNQTAVLGAGGVSLTPSPPVASVTSPSGVASGPQATNVASLPQQFSIQQTITIKLTGNGTGVPAAQAYSGSVASGTIPPDAPPPNTVPAPAGLILALTAVPVLGLRRGLRRRAAATA